MSNSSKFTKLLGIAPLGPFLALMLVLPSAAHAVVIDVEGATSSGLNDSSTNAQDIGPFSGGTLNVFGWIDMNNVNDRDIFRFELTIADTIHFDIDYADDVNAPDFDNDDGLDGVLSVFNSAGQTLGYADDVGFTPDPGSGANGDHDPLLTLTLDPGIYYVAVTSWDNFATQTIDSWYNLGATTGQYCLQVRNGQGFDAPANDCGSGSVPTSAGEPETLLLLAGAIVLGGVTRRRFGRMS